MNMQVGLTVGEPLPTWGYSYIETAPDSSLPLIALIRTVLHNETISPSLAPNCSLQLTNSGISQSSVSVSACVFVRVTAQELRDCCAIIHTTIQDDGPTDKQQQCAAVGFSSKIVCV